MNRLLTYLVLLAATLAGGAASAQTYRTVTEYDAARRPIKVTDPHGNITHKFYDADGNVVREARQAPGSQWLVTCIVYSFTGKKAFVIGPYITASKDTCPSGSDLAVPRSEFGYDGADRLDNETIRLNPSGGEGDRVTRTKFDAAGQTIQIRRAVASASEQAYATYDYTPNGKLKYVIDANGNRAQLTWDGYDRQSCWIFPASTLPTGFNPTSPTTALATAGAVSGDCVTTGDYERYGYDNNGNRLTLRKRDTKTITYAYDPLNRVTSKAVPPSSTGALGYNVFYGYDLRGLQIYARFASATGEGITNVYDKAGRLESSTNNMGGTARTLAYLYDKVSNRTRLTHPGGTIYFTYAWDEQNRLTQIAENGETALITPSYDSLSRRTTLTRGGSATDYSYDAVSRLSGIAHDLAATNADLTLGFGYNRAGQIVSRTQSNDLYANTAHYDVNRPYTRNGLNQYTAAGPVTFTNDQNGNLRADTANTFSYDTENRLTAVSGAYTASLVYDPMGRLYQTSGGAAGTTQFLYDGDALVAEYDNAGNVIRRYVHGSRVDEPLVWYEGSAVGSANRRQLFANHQGSIVAMADASGQIIGTNAYDAWGIANATNFGRFAYTGQIAIPEAGIYHYKARAYSPTLGRFLQIDPVGYKDQMNLYAYVGNDAVNVNDPDGLCGRRYDDGTCRVKVKANTGEAGRAAGRQLELRLNLYDQAVNALANNAIIPIVDKGGNTIGTIRGSDFKRVWNRTKFTVTNRNFNHGGGGAGISGNWNSSGTYTGGNSMYNPGVIQDMENRAKTNGHAAVDGIDTLIFHELSHNTPYGRMLTQLHPAHAGPFHQADWDREWGASAAGKAMANEVGANYVCAATGCQ